MTATTVARAEESIKDVTEILEKIIDLIKKLAGGESTPGGSRRRRRSTESSESSTSTGTSILQTLDDVTNTVSTVLVVLFIHYISATAKANGVTIVDVISYGIGSMVTIVIDQLEIVKHKITAAYAIRTAVRASAFFVSIVSEDAEKEIEKAAERVFANAIVKAIGDAFKDVVEKSLGESPTAAAFVIEGIEALIKNAVPGTKFYDTVKQAIVIMSAISRARPLGGPNTDYLLLSLLEQTVGRLYRSAENIMVLTVIVFKSMDGKPETRLYRHRHFHRHSHRHEHKETYPLSCKLPFIPRCLYKT
ncbi:hypothetical protein BEWA_049560 [Theileria equi strain WA]|uniref:Uncharacterized protein n=1 Tax=Theileria equi strain WA TaxID=1537102 RepID=L1LB42_THEEQ|nr:hypothetical protein BEWA_049560 [Theileria equi strain WA]EKX72489.1 hypothetical protein BEWA_049560 [Theileria equi strain WA]|eukprot:XP_004831941.1 hypothetical protein BEWA_049560 [Theileria equi strain WA]